MLERLHQLQQIQREVFIAAIENTTAASKMDIHLYLSHY
jgi:hypothetical protein